MNRVPRVAPPLYGNDRTPAHLHFSGRFRRSNRERTSPTAQLAARRRCGPHRPFSPAARRHRRSDRLRCRLMAGKIYHQLFGIAPLIGTTGRPDPREGAQETSYPFKDFIALLASSVFACNPNAEQTA